MNLTTKVLSAVLSFAAMSFSFSFAAEAIPITATAGTASKKMVSGDEAFARITKLTTEIPWYTSLDYAKKRAQQENKPIFWMHMLGPLNGKT